MKGNVLRQLVDIQIQGEQILKGNPTVSEIENYGNYSKEMKKYLLSIADFPQLVQLVNEIPVIPENKFTVKNGLMGLIIPNVLLHWYYEREYIAESKTQISIGRGKFASIEFILKNSLK